MARHNPRVIWLEYRGEGPIKQTLMLVGKVVAFMSGGLFFNENTDNILVPALYWITDRQIINELLLATETPLQSCINKTN